jgi:hypothetical protein
MAPPPEQAPPQLLFVGQAANKVAGALKNVAPTGGLRIDCGMALPKTIVLRQEFEDAGMQMLPLPRHATAGLWLQKIAARLRDRDKARLRESLMGFIFEFLLCEVSPHRCGSTNCDDRQLQLRAVAVWESYRFFDATKIIHDMPFLGDGYSLMRTNLKNQAISLVSYSPN